MPTPRLVGDAGGPLDVEGREVVLAPFRINHEKIYAGAPRELGGLQESLKLPGSASSEGARLNSYAELELDHPCRLGG
jgi:hypothetical protein